MNVTEYLIECLAEEGVGVAKDCCKANRFTIDDRNFLNPTGPTNRERIVEELNDLMGVVELMVGYNVLPKNWRSESKIAAKKLKLLDMMAYSQKVGALVDRQRTAAGQLAKKKGERKCRRCGCTQNNACLSARDGGACSWVEKDLCSACLSGREYKRYLAGDLNPSRGK